MRHMAAKQMNDGNHVIELANGRASIIIRAVETTTLLVTAEGL
jgi:hypothetical protein